MNIEIAKYNQFDRFLGYEMTDEEKEQFQQKLDSDQDLQREFEEYKALIGSVKELENEQFRNQLLERGRSIIQQEYANKENEADDTKIRSLWRQKYFRWVAVAASIIILLVPVSLYFYNSIVVPNQLFNQYYTPYQNVVAPPVRGEEKKTAINQSLESYTAKNYEQAIIDLQALIDKNPQLKEEVALYLGISHLETGNHEKAIDLFQDLIQTETQFNDQARWYLAMSYLNKRQTENARQQLQLLAKDKSSSYQQKAKQVLDQL